MLSFLLMLDPTDRLGDYSSKSMFCMGARVMQEASSMQIEFEFKLPRGYVDLQGKVHRTGRMRLATAYDENTPLVDPRIRENQACLVISLLSRVITKLGAMDMVNARAVADRVYELMVNELRLARMRSNPW